ncbi:MAG: hypothetical protein IGBAC_0236 [Ignavibacteriae bacterium]|nr:MAG: hypothetical protein IGBAC_0236 [Ignavibacteriota bacterium]
MKSRLLAILLIFVFATQSFALLDEGMWLLDAINRLNLSDFKKNGLELTPEQIYNPNGSSIKDAIVSLGGGTGSFVSNKGLIITNHHVAYGAIVSVSTVIQDRLKDGFLAKTYEEEIPVENMTAQVLISMKDITNEVTSVIKPDMSPAEQQKAINAKLREIEAREKGNTEYECRASEIFYGVKYYLFTYEVIKDIRLVYCPPNAIGNYGGEIDNWIWPRHTGDFSFLRAYVSPEGKTVKYSKDNVPYVPRHFLPISTQGFQEGSFMMIIGYPGRTFRYRTSADIKFAYEEALPLSIDLFKTRIDILNKWAKKDRAIELKLASRLRGLENTYKNYLGVLDGMRRLKLIQLKTQEEQKFMDFLSSNPELKSKYGNILNEIETQINDLRTYNKKRTILATMFMSCDMLRLGQRLMNYTTMQVKDSTGKIKPKTEAERSQVKSFINSVHKTFIPEVDKENLIAIMLQAAELPEAQSIKIIQKITKGKTGEKLEKAIRKFVDELYDDTKLNSLESAEKLLMKDDEDIREDEFVEFAIELEKDDAPIREKYSAYESKMNFLRKNLMEAYLKWKGENIYPDANRTMRLTYGTVKPLKPRDAVYWDYVTSLKGVMEKETGSEPFEVPVKLKNLWETKNFGNYRDEKINDVPVAFISNLDITGGNSGSPIINGKGELAGVAFDGNWEGVVGDYYFEEPMNRAISVDSRYVLFILDKFSNAQNLLKEMQIR